MPLAPPRPCRTPMCAGKTTHKHGYCDKHADQEVAWKKSSNTKQDRGGRPWHRKRQRVLQRDKGLCQPCLKQGLFTAAAEVDHVVNIASGGTDSDGNLQAICGPCHKAKTQQEARRGRVDRLDKAVGTSEGIGDIMVDAADTMTASIDPLIDNMDTMQDVAVLAATIMAGRYAAAFAESSKEVATNTAETIADTRANIAVTAAARAKAAEVLRVAQAEQAAATRALANGHAIAAATGNTTLRSKAITQMAAANQRAIAAEAAHTSAVNANAAAMARNTAAAYSIAAAGVLALVGGPVGAAVLAGTAAYYIGLHLRCRSRCA